MSGIALIWAANVKGLKPAAKVVLIQLADFHNKETGRCDPSAQRLADDCEMDRATVFRHMNTLEEKRLVTRHSKGDGSGGRGSNQYELHLDIVLGASSRHKEKSQIATGGGSRKNGGEKSQIATGVVAKCDTNLTKEPHLEPLSVAAPQNLEDLFEDFLSAHPRPRDQERTRELWDGIVEAGADPQDLIRAARIYADEQKGNAKHFIAGSDSWLDRKGHLDALRAKAPPPSVEKVNEGIANTIKKGKPFLVTHITDTKAAELVAQGLVTVDQCAAVGLRP